MNFTRQCVNTEARLGSILSFEFRASGERVEGDIADELSPGGGRPHQYITYMNYDSKE